jgi:branched-chain amino acid transport system substrate-binding protein
MKRAMTRAIGWCLATLMALATEDAATQPTPIKVGISAGLSGGQAQYSRDVTRGIEACFTALNKQGGIGGRSLQLVAEDDGGKRDQVVVNTKKLIEQHKVVALIGYTSGAGVEASLSYLDSQSVPLIGPVTGNMGIRAQHHKNLFHTRAGYGEEMRRMIGVLANTGVKRFAIAFLDDVGPANPQSMKDALAQNGLTAVAEVPLNRNAEEFSAQIATLLQSKPDAVVFISNAKPIVQIVMGMRAQGYAGQFATSSFSGVGIVEELKGGGRGLIMSQVLPPPSKTVLRVVADYEKHLKELDAEAKPNYTSLESYIAARVLAEGIRRAGPGASPERIVGALETMASYDLGGYEISFSPSNHNGSRRVDTGVVSAEGKLLF